MHRLARGIRIALGVPLELGYRLLGLHWTAPATIRFTCPGCRRSITTRQGQSYDRFTLAPNLRKQDGTPSDADQHHDTGWREKAWDVDTICHVEDMDAQAEALTFDHNNANFTAVLLRERAIGPATLRLYVMAVSSDFMRRRWERQQGHPDAPEDCPFVRAMAERAELQRASVRLPGGRVIGGASALRLRAAA